MIFRRPKPNYEHIAQLEQELFSPEEPKKEQPKRKEFFSPPILEKKTSYPVAPTFAMSATSHSNRLLNNAIVLLASENY